jgi:hypothetical protein
MSAAETFAYFRIDVFVCHRFLRLLITPFSHSGPEVPLAYWHLLYFFKVESFVDGGYGFVFPVQFT